MNCSKVHKLISPYIDGELTERDVRALEDHIKVCSRCRTDLEEGKELHSLLSGADIFKAPYGFHTRVMANLGPGKTKQGSSLVLLLRFAEAAAIILVIAFGILSGNLMTHEYRTDKTGDVTALLSLDVFNSAPPGSIGGVYLAMTGAGNEK